MRRSLFDQYQPEEIKPPRIQPNFFARLAQFCFKNALWVVFFWSLLTIACVGYSIKILRSTESQPLSFSQSTNARTNANLLDANFPNLYGLSKITLSSTNPENVRLARKDLISKLEDRPELFATVLSPGSGNYYDTNGMLYVSAEKVQASVDYALSLRPLFTAIAEQPTTESLTTLVNEVQASIESGRDPQGLDALFSEAAKSVKALMKGVERPVDWTVVAGLAVDPAPLEARFLVVPKLGKNAEAAKFLKAAVLEVLRPYPDDKNKLFAVEEMGDTTDEIKSVAHSSKNIWPLVFLGSMLAMFVLFAVLGHGGLSAMVMVPALVTASISAATFAALLPRYVAPGWFVILSVALLTLNFSVHYAFAALEAFSAARARTSAVMLAGQRQGSAITWTLALMAAPWLAWALIGDRDLGAFAALAAISLLVGFVASLSLVPAIAALVPGPLRWQAAEWVQPVYDVLVYSGVWQHILKFTGGLAIVGALTGLWFAPTLFEVSSQPQVFAEKPVYLLAKNQQQVDDILLKLKLIPEVEHVQWLGTFLPSDVATKQKILASLSDQFSAITPVQSQDPATVRDQISSLLDSLQIITKSPATRPELALAAQEFRRSLELLYGTSDDREVVLFEKRMFGSFNVLVERAQALGKIAEPDFAALEPQLQNLFLSPAGVFRITVRGPKDLPPSQLAKLLFEASLPVVNPAMLQQTLSETAKSTTFKILGLTLTFGLFTLVLKFRQIANLLGRVFTGITAIGVVAAIAKLQHLSISVPDLLLYTIFLSTFLAATSAITDRRNDFRETDYTALQFAQSWLAPFTIASLALAGALIVSQPVSQILLQLAMISLLTAIVWDVVQRPILRWLKTRLPSAS